MPRCTPCIIPYNGKVRQESLQFREPMTAGVVLFTKSSREGHGFAAIIFYSVLVPNKRTYLFFLPLLFSNTHRQKALTLPRSGSSVVLRQAVRFCVHQPPLSKGGGTGAARDGRIPTTGKLSWKRNPSVIACGDASPLSQGGHSGKDSAMFTKNSCRRHDSAAIIRYSIRVPRKNEDFSPITLSPLQTHTGKRP